MAAYIHVNLFPIMLDQDRNCCQPNTVRACYILNAIPQYNVQVEQYPLKVLPSETDFAPDGCKEMSYMRNKDSVTNLSYKIS